MTLPLLGDFSNMFVRQVSVMEPSLQDIFNAQVVKGNAAWALPGLRVREIHRCRARAQADAAAAWLILNTEKNENMDN